MELIYLKREEIDTEKWNDLVNQNSTISVSNFTWFLDIVCEKWGAYKAKDQDLFFPLPYLKGVKNKMLYQPIFSRVLSMIAKPGADLKPFIQALRKQIPKDFKHYLFHADFAMNANSKERKYQKIEGFDGIEGLRNLYSTNAKRQIKKYPMEEIEVLTNSNITEGMDLIKKELKVKIPELKDEQFRILNKLVTTSMRENGGYILNLSNNPEIRASAFFIRRGKDLVFLKGAARQEDMKRGAMYTLMDHAFEKFGDQINCIDFDGSNIDSVAQFYYRFGGKDYTYYENANTGKIPIQYSIIKKLF